MGYGSKTRRDPGWGSGSKTRGSATGSTNGTRQDGGSISILIKCILYGGSATSLVGTTIESNPIGSQTWTQPWSRTRDPTTESISVSGYATSFLSHFKTNAASIASLHVAFPSYDDSSLCALTWSTGCTFTTLTLGCDVAFGTFVFGCYESITGYQYARKYARRDSDGSTEATDSYAYSTESTYAGSTYGL